jgi:hydroxyacylglutathione hydrolase
VLVIKRILNNPINSNCYIIHAIKSINAVIIDPGSRENSKIFAYLDDNKLNIEYIILTHEHFDHIWGVDSIREKYGSKVVSSNACSQSIINPKKNLSLFYDQVGFSISESDISFIGKEYGLFWNGFEIFLYKTPGHSPGGICILVDGNFFTGDTLLKNDKIVTKLPGGSSADLEESNNFILSIRNRVDKIYPGHGDMFYGSEITQILLS